MFQKIEAELNRETPIYPLALFRMIFGLLIFAESVGAIFTGWVKRTFLEPNFTFTFIGFEFLQAPDGGFMYAYYILMGALGIMIMLGFYYRMSLSLFLIMWTVVYWMQKSNYNNHYYLLILLCVLMLITPAHKAFSLDTRLNRVKMLSSYKELYRWMVIIQLWIIYTFASIAKINPDWLAGKPVRIWFRSKSDYPIIGSLLQEESFQQVVVYGGVFFDLLIIPLLLYRKTRFIAFCIAIFFHLFNSAVFQIGIFPYLMIATSLFFFPSKMVENIFFRKSKLLEETNPKKNVGPILYSSLILYFLVQLALPLRHHCFLGDVNWTEEGHRMSWRMMLRSKSGTIRFKIVTPEGEEEIIKPVEYMTMDQYRTMASKPDMIWQFAQRLKKQYADQGVKVKIYADCKVSLNGSERRRFIDLNTDLASVKWERFKHAEWIILND